MIRIMEQLAQSYKQSLAGVLVQFEIKYREVNKSGRGQRPRLWQSGGALCLPPSQPVLNVDGA